MSDSERVIRNPSPEEIEAKIKQTSAVVEEQTDEQQEVQIADNKNQEQPIQSSDDDIKPNESIFSPQMFPHKLIMGPIYKNPKIKNGEVMIRRMTALEESLFYDIITKGSVKIFFETITKALKTCVRTNIDIEKELFLNEKIPLFIHVLALTYGENKTFDIECPTCWQVTKLKLNIIKDIKNKYFPKNGKFPVPIKLASYGIPITLHLTYPKIESESLYLDLVENEEQPTAKWIIKIRKLVDHIDGSLPDGSPIGEQHYDQIMNNLGIEDTKRIKKEMENLSSHGSLLHQLRSKFCENAQCSMWKQEQPVTIPVDQLFINMFVE